MLPFAYANMQSDQWRLAHGNSAQKCDGSQLPPMARTLLHGDGVANRQNHAPPLRGIAEQDLQQRINLNCCGYRNNSKKQHLLPLSLFPNEASLAPLAFIDRCFSPEPTLTCSCSDLRPRRRSAAPFELVRHWPGGSIKRSAPSSCSPHAGKNSQNPRRRLCRRADAAALPRRPPAPAPG